MIDTQYREDLREIATTTDGDRFHVRTAALLELDRRRRGTSLRRAADFEPITRPATLAEAATAA